jgi:hypothetical protein
MKTRVDKHIIGEGIKNMLSFTHNTDASEVALNLYQLDLNLHLQGQTSQYLVLSHLNAM